MNKQKTRHEENKLSKSHETDVLIIGGGLAGCVLAYQLLEQGKRAIVLDEPHHSTASRVGAGIINPISGKRYSSIWNAKEVLPSALNFYQKCTDELPHKPDRIYCREVPTLRMFATEEERNFWEIKRAQEHHFAQLRETRNIDELYDKPSIHAPFGALQFPSWRVETEVLVADLRNALARRDALWEDFFDETLLELSNDAAGGLRYKNFSAKKIVVCHGWKAHKSSLWGTLPLSPAKGELLTVRLKSASLRHLLVKGTFLLPLFLSSSGDNASQETDLVRIGASYEWEQLDDRINADVGVSLLESAQAIFPTEMQIVEHRAGVRPAAKDSRPFLGVHPRYKQCFVMNGFGAKGAVLVPYCAEQLALLMDGRGEIPREIALERFLGKEP